MSKKNKNILLVLVGVFFVSLALLFSENYTKVIGFPEKVEKEVGQVFSDEFIFGSKNDEVEEDFAEQHEEEVIEENESSQVSANYYKVVNVVDGDTVDVIIDGKEERLRLIGIDTPETKDPRKGVECFGKEASEKTKELLLNKRVSLERDVSQSEKDRYGRLLRYVFLDDGTNFNLLMIREGYANEYTYDSAYKYQKEFKEAERVARENKKGLWGEACSAE